MEKHRFYPLMFVGGLLLCIVLSLAVQSRSLDVRLQSITPQDSKILPLVEKTTLSGNLYVLDQQHSIISPSIGEQNSKEESSVNQFTNKSQTLLQLKEIHGEEQSRANGSQPVDQDHVTQGYNHENQSQSLNFTKSSQSIVEQHTDRQKYNPGSPINQNEKQPVGTHHDSNGSHFVEDLEKNRMGDIHKDDSLISNNSLVLAASSVVNRKEPAISYSLSKKYSQKSSIKTGYGCGNRSTPEASINRYFDFVTEMRTSLNILFMGDSISVLMAKAAEIASGAMNETGLHFTTWKRKKVDYPMPIVEAASVNGGGVIASWRLTGFLSRRSMGKKLPNSGPGWRKGFAKSLKNFAKTNGRTSNFDVLVFRVSHPWIRINEVTWEALEETVVMAKSLLGVKTVVLLTAGFNNNILTMDDLQGFREMNNRIRNYAKNDSSLHDIRVLDIEQYTDEIIRYNAQEIGYVNETLERVYFHKLKPFRTQIGYAATTIPQVCAEQVPDNSQECASKNAYSFDGLHPCIAKVGPRIFATLACLLQCVRQDMLCQDGCTTKFMVPLREIRWQHYLQSMSR